MTIRVGLIGLGEVAQLMHLPLLADDPRFAIEAVMDVAPSLVAHVADRYNVRRRYGRAEDLLADEALDAVFILSPDHVHAMHLGLAIAADKHVFIEKPVCLAEPDLQAAIAAAQGTRRTIFVGYMRRYARGFHALKARMPAAGEIVYVRVRDLICEGPFFIRQTRPVFRPDDVPADIIAESRRVTDRMLRSVVGADASPEEIRAYQVLTGLSSHSLSAMRELLGPPRRVIAARQNRGENVVALLDYGRFTAIYEALIDNVARFDARIEVIADRQQLVLNYDTPYVRNLPTRLEITRSSDTETGTEIVGPIYEDPFRIELDAFHDCVEKGTAPKTSLRDSIDDLRLFADIARAFRSGADRPPSHA
ncbi:MAG TPA: Gfo/Idh/MocA family oxidoreductase [Dongiaceae bacterium]|nr:Gfo/Idh/MocA family oxidoreductase [Dongiaceae bacterium]